MLLSYPERVAELPLVLGHHVAVNLPGIVIVALVTWVLVIGMRESAWLNNAMVALKLAVLALFVGVGALYLDPRNWAPFAPNGWRGIHQGAAIVFFAYIGFDAVSTAAEETKDPQRNMPRGILGSLAHLHADLRRRRPGRDRPRALRAAEGLGPARPRVRGRRARLGPGDHLLRRDRLDDRGAAGVPARPAPHLLLDEPGRPAAARLPRRPPRATARRTSRRSSPGVVVALGATLLDDDETYDLTNIGTLFAFLVVCLGVLALRLRDPGRPGPSACRSSGWWRRSGRPRACS